MNFKKTTIRQQTKLKHSVTEASKYWSHLSSPVLVKEYGAIDYIDVSPTEPYKIAVSCSSRVQIYCPLTHQVFRQLTRFKEATHGAVYRSDGKLILAGSDDKHVRLFDPIRKDLLRMYKGHTAPVYRCKFLPDSTKLASFSDDRTACIWDLPTETQLNKFEGHTDYIRAGAASYTSSEILLTGSYDHMVKLYDARSGNSNVLTMDHGAQVESVLMYPSGTVVASVGGTEVCIWDILAGGKLIARFLPHHKTITCMAMASGGKKILTGSIDKKVKVIDVQNYDVVHTITYDSPVVSLGISNDDATIVAGMTDGMISMRHRKSEEEMQKEKEKKERSKLQPVVSHIEENLRFKPSTGDVVISAVDPGSLPRYDLFLRKFQYSAALTEVLRHHIVKNMPNVTVSVIHELIRRQGLAQAVAGRDSKQLLPLLRFINSNITHPDYARTAMDLLTVVLDIYEDSTLSSEVLQLMDKLKGILEKEEYYMKELMVLQGSLGMIMSTASLYTYDENTITIDKDVNLTPSDNALSIDYAINIR
ncbi:U3 small nucleolar RNA-associated protein 15 homolog [Artemia franciscana]